MENSKLLHIFKAGTWTTMSGQPLTFSQADLEATAKAYDPAASKAPLVVGHPKHDDPAQGWVADVIATPKGLFAKASKVNPAFADSVKAGRYGAVSAKFYTPDDPRNPKPGVWYLQHVGFLGGMNPAVKGLQEPAFSESDDPSVYFAESIDLVDMTLDVESPDPSNEEITNPINVQSEMENAVDKTEELASLAAERDALQQQVAALQAEKAQAETAKRHDHNVAFAESLINDGRLVPADKAKVLAVMDVLNVPEPVQFGEGDKAEPIVETFKTLFKQLPKQVEFGEHATTGKAAVAAVPVKLPVEFAEAEPERLELHARTLQIAKEQNLSYEKAARVAMSE